MKKKLKTFDCWICKDSGLLISEITYGKTSYEVGYRCSCKEGLNFSEMIPLVKKDLAENLAMDNYNKASSVALNSYQGSFPLKAYI